MTKHQERATDIRKLLHKYLDVNELGPLMKFSHACFTYAKEHAPERVINKGTDEETTIRGWQIPDRKEPEDTVFQSLKGLMGGGAANTWVLDVFESVMKMWIMEGIVQPIAVNDGFSELTLGNLAEAIYKAKPELGLASAIDIAASLKEAT